ncbi:MAG TPA: RecX family transcriptional regulator [Stellaceae bacterium]|nr:RecX family transcriptional regulator [Stellaceae bacterium]
MPVAPELIEKWALSYLERYASSAANLRRVLRRRVLRASGYDDDEMRSADPLIDALIARYRATSLLDDSAYAASRTRRGVARGHSLRRIAAGLAAKGIGMEEAAAALAVLRDTDADPDLAAACAYARRRHLGPYRRDRSVQAADTDTRQRELGAFARAGFTRRTAETVLACHDEAAIAELLAEGSEQL